MNNSTLHFPNLYSLENAALTLNHTQDEILRAASEGAMEIIFGLPPDYECRIVEISTASEEVVSSRPTRIAPLFFILGECHCLRLMASALATVDSSTVGYLYNASRGFSQINPSQHDTYVDASSIPNEKMLGLANQRFAFFKGGEISKCRVTKDMIFLQTSALAKFKQSLKFNLYRYNSENLPAEYRHEDFLREYGSIKLEKMFIASTKFWFSRGIVKNDNRTYPKIEEVVKWFMAQGYDETPAKQYASIIRPEWAVMGRIKGPDDE